MLLVFWAILLCTALGLRERASREGFGWIDPSCLSLAPLGEGCDPRWESLFRDVVDAAPLLRSDDTVALDELVGAIEELAFVARVDEVRVLWPDALELTLALRTPVACIPVGDRYQPVAADGTVLPGLWPLPPTVAGAVLPVLGPLADGSGLFLHARAGDFLVEPEHLDALDVALSLRASFEHEDRARLGPVVIDATEPDAFATTNVTLELACGRVVAFGRAPRSAEPGDVPVAMRWEAVRQALALLDETEPNGGGLRVDPSKDWCRIDVRWDHPAVEFVAPLLVDSELEAAAELPRAPVLANARRATRPGLGRSEGGGGAADGGARSLANRTSAAEPAPAPTGRSGSSRSSSGSKVR